MKEIPLTKGQFATVDDADYEWLNKWKWHAWWSNTTLSFYAVRTTPKIDGKRLTVRMHREVLGLPWKGRSEQTDHIDHNTLDNRRENLRVVTCQQNNTNRRKRTDNTSGVKGVYWRKETGKYRVQIQVGGRKIMLGQYPTLEEAARVSHQAILNHHSEFARVQ